uniref:Uncharacterized protein n=1 Tax=Octopus bimaculoides TaxID=37653 RepID=A0A0L8I9G6_OCTBM
MSHFGKLQSKLLGTPDDLYQNFICCLVTNKHESSSFMSLAKKKYYTSQISHSTHYLNQYEPESMI